tara:strand:- start:759 stop:1133 length:375 start_codon:yes stop_codon:yes gene_type:complete
MFTNELWNKASGGASYPRTTKGIFAYGSGVTAISNLVSNTGVVASDVAGVGTARAGLGACTYGYDKGVYRGGSGTGNSPVYSTSNLVSNTGVMGSDVTGVGTARSRATALSYGEDKGIYRGGFA